ncbi:hypothetical protein [Ligilactobacillus faecis]|uniref:hypothetical protein n=1 Tax=Ligilactobacillus faecis TaxID=762833 RepID=UPI002469386C|nr:hypothetical protein [Ligilactobacillus faecis]WGN89589.1 hypothetical protein QFX10_00320 [Ligilactobacillus faecis]
MYKLAYKNNFFGKVMIDQFEDEMSMIAVIERLRNKYYICYVNENRELYILHYGWTGKESKTILGSFLHSILYPSVTDWDIFKIENHSLYRSIRWYFYICPVAFFGYIGLILTWLPISSASLLDRVSITFILMMCFKSLKHEMETSIMKKINLYNKKK